ncbi:MAG: MBOAT family protein [Oscillospiraceae bacterium]|nr:MBOAT family protein [Oscillospiraceae bacterium]
MVFSNLIFLCLFLPANILLYYLTRNPAWRNGVLIFFSLFFYAWGEPVWVTLLIFSATIDYFHGRLCEKYTGRWQAKAALVSSLVLNLGLLGVFKYSGMAVESLNALTGLSLPVPTFSLPIGISFYTFQTISYVVDVYRGQVRAQQSYWRFFMYVSMYPQLVAGPIVRYKEVAAQIDSRHTDREDFVKGISRFCAGLGKKVLIANLAGDFASQYLDGDLSALTTAGAWFGILMFTLQIYFDFSGYSDMAIGLARLFGFHYMENFHYPYISQSVSEFWRRWHISLGSFFRDYVYIPLGGNRTHTFRNLLVVWFLTGLWHGASWNFVLWGLYFGLLIFLEKQFLQKILQRLPRVLRHLYLLFAVTISWSLFYFTDLSRLWTFLQTLFGAQGAGLWDIQLEVELLNHLFWLIAAVIGCMPILPWAKEKWKLLQKPRWAPFFENGVGMAWNLLVLFLCAAFLAGQSYNPFLYFRF